MCNGKVTDISSKRPASMSVLSKSYLSLYNGIQSAGWSYLLYKTVKSLLLRQPLWPECSSSVIIFQSLAFLEVLHCLVGLVPSSALITFVQVFSRVFMVWGILVPVEQSQISPTLGCMLIAWGVTEVIRYSYYFTNLLGITPHFLTWCRYTFFTVLYPLGVTGEIGTVYYALETIKKTKLYSLELPNKLNISFNYYFACLFLMASYVPIFPQLYFHMLRQRRKLLGSPIDKEAKKTK